MKRCAGHEWVHPRAARNGKRRERCCECGAKRTTTYVQDWTPRVAGTLKIGRKTLDVVDVTMTLGTKKKYRYYYPKKSLAV